MDRACSGCIQALARNRYAAKGDASLATHLLYKRTDAYARPLHYTGIIDRKAATGAL